MKRSSVLTQLLRLVALSSLMIVAALETSTNAVTSTTGKEFMYWDNDSVLAGHANHVSITKIDAFVAQDVINRLATLDPTIKVIVRVTYPLLSNNLCAATPAPQWAAFASGVAPYLGRIAAFDIGHEDDLSGVSCFGLGDPLRQQKMANLLYLRSRMVKDALPGAKTYITYGPAPELWSGGALAPDIDWNGFDCYGPFENCWSTGHSIPWVVDQMVARLTPQQSIVLIADASCFMYHERGHATHESELFIRGLQYWQLAKTHPRVVGLIGFIWDYQDVTPGNPHSFAPASNLHTVVDSPGLSTLYYNIGLNLLQNVVPTYSQISVAPDCAIPNGATSCTINFSWTTTSGPGIGVWARLRGDQNVVYGPLCPGASACALPAPPGDYILEVREIAANPNSRLIDAKDVKVRYGNGTPTGQFTYVTDRCEPVPANPCNFLLTANTQNAPNASVFMNGQPYPQCTTRTSFCESPFPLAPPGVYPLTLQLRADTNPGSALLDQRVVNFVVP